MFTDSISIVSFTPFLALMVKLPTSSFHISETLACKRSAFEHKFISRIWSHVTHLPITKPCNIPFFLHCVYNMGSKLDNFLRTRYLLFCFVHVLLISLPVQIMRKIYISSFSYKDVILFSKIFYMFDVVYVNKIAFHANFLVWNSRQRCKERNGISVIA